MKNYMYHVVTSSGGGRERGRGSSHLNSLSFIILIISDAKASGSPRHSTFLAACKGEDIIVAEIAQT